MSLLYYTLLRLLMLLSVGGLAYAFGMRGFLLLLTAFLGSGVLSYFILDRVRNSAGQQLGGFFHRVNDRIDAATRAEDQDEEETDPSTRIEGPDTTHPSSTSESQRHADGADALRADA